MVKNWAAEGKGKVLVKTSPKRDKEFVKGMEVVLCEESCCR